MASEKITNILEEIKALTILELADLVKAVEEEFGVSAAAPVGVVAAAGAAAAPAAEEKTEFDVRSPVSALRKLRTWLRVAPRLLRKAFPRTKQTRSRLLSKRQAQLLKLSNLTYSLVSNKSFNSVVNFG